jgi:hypothetical protein
MARGLSLAVRRVGRFRATHARAQQRPYCLRATGLVGSKSKIFDGFYHACGEQELEADASSAQGFQFVPTQDMAPVSKRCWLFERPRALFHDSILEAVLE